MIEQRLLLKAIVKSLQDGRVEFKCERREQALVLRTNFYRFLKIYRNAEAFDENVFKFIETMQLSIKGSSLVLEPKVMVQMMPIIARTLGTTVEREEQALTLELEKELKGTTDQGERAPITFEQAQALAKGKSYNADK